MRKPKNCKTIVKRSGIVVAFDGGKIRTAIQKAALEVGETIDKEFFPRVLRYVEDGMTVEDIQDLIEHKLQASRYKDTAKAYIKYRYERELIRRDYETLGGTVERLISDGDDENSNKDSKANNVMRDLIAGEVIKLRAKNLMAEKLYEAHKNKSIHIHDLDYAMTYLTNCCVINLKDMLENGTVITNADIVKPKSIEVASTITSQIVARVAQSQYGGVSIADFNEILAPYAEMSFKKHLIANCKLLKLDYPAVEKSTGDEFVLETKHFVELYRRAYDDAIEKTEKSIYDACQTFEYQVNTISGNSQTPFVTIGFDIPTSNFSKKIAMSYYDVRMAGLGAKRKMAIFPKLNQVFVDGQNLRKGDPHYDMTLKAVQCMSKFFYPDGVLVSPEDYANRKYTFRMGCRSNPPEFYNEDGSYMRYGRFNIGVVTLNVPQIALESLKSGRKFDDILAERFDLMEEAIMHRFNFIKDMKAKHSPILFVDGAIARLDPEDSLESLFRTKQGSISFGYMGLHDAVRILNEDISLEDMHSEVEKIMAKIDEFIQDCAVRNDIPLSAYGTPAESLVSTAYDMDLINYEDVMPEWLKKNTYYCNSFHYPSELPIDAFEKIEYESDFVEYSGGGNIVYAEIGMVGNNPLAILELLQHAYDCGVTYYANNIRADHCFECGYRGRIEYIEKNNGYECPNCGNTDGDKMDVVLRVCGYLGQYNKRKAKKGRMKEMYNRVEHI